MRVLLTGATGVIGRALARELVLAGHELAVLTRDPSRLPDRFPYPAQAFPWPEGGSPPVEAFAGVAAVVHLAGEPLGEGRWTEEKKAKMRRSRVEGTRELLQRLHEARGRLAEDAVLVSASAIGFYGEQGQRVLTEEAARGDGFLPELCEDWERESAACTLRTVILRIGVVLTREGGAIPTMYPAFRAEIAGPLAGGRQWMSCIHLHDMVAILLAAISSPSWSGVYNAVAPEPATNAQFTRAFSGRIQVPAVLPVPALAVRVGFGEVAIEVLASHRVVPARLLAAGFVFKFADIEAIFEDLFEGPGEDLLVRDQLLPGPIHEVFGFFSDARNLERLTPPWLHFEVLGASDADGAPRPADAVVEGMLLDYRLRLHGVPVSWRTRIERWNPPFGFVDTQLQGPYALWHHEHLFHEVAGGTLMRDRVRYKLPLGLPGRLVAGGWVDSDVVGIFDWRKKAILEHFRGNHGPQPA